MKKSITVLALLLFSTIFMVACSADNNPAQIATVSRLYPRYNLTELLERTELVVKGTVTGQSDPFKVKPATDGDISIFVDFTIEIDKVYRGDIEQKSLDLRLQGGEVDDLRVEVEDEPQIKIGTTYIFFLIKPTSGGMYVTEGDYYLLTSGPQSVFSKVSKNEVTRSSSQVEISHIDGFLSASTFTGSNDTIYANVEIPSSSQGASSKSVLSKIDQESIVLDENVFSQESQEFEKDSPFDPQFYDNETRENLKANLDAGIITQEAYDELMNFEWPYAEIEE